MATLNDQLDAYRRAQDAAERTRLRDDIWGQYGVEGAVLVLDMSGFARLTQKHGVVHYLSMVRTMQLTVEPIVQDHGGQLVKFEADDCFATFQDTVNAALSSLKDAPSAATSLPKMTN